MHGLEWGKSGDNIKGLPTTIKFGAGNMERQTGGNLGAAYPRSRNLQGRRDLASYAGHQRSAESHWVRPAGLFFAVGVVKTCSSFTDLKRPEAAFKMFIRFVLAKAAVGYGLDLMLAVFKIIQGMVSTIITQSGLSGSSGTTLPQEIIDKINNVGFWDSIPCGRSPAGRPVHYGAGVYYDPDGV